MVQRAASTSSTEDLRDLLLEELAAVVVYGRAIRKLQGVPPADDLDRLHDQHVAAAAVLRRFAPGPGPIAVAPAGPWAAFVKEVACEGPLLENRRAVRALCEGEEHATTAYERFLRHGDLEPEVRRAVELSVLPAQRRHAGAIERALGAA